MNGNRNAANLEVCEPLGNGLLQEAVGSGRDAEPRLARCEELVGLLQRVNGE